MNQRRKINRKTVILITSFLVVFALLGIFLANKAPKPAPDAGAPADPPIAETLTKDEPQETEHTETAEGEMIPTETTPTETKPIETKPAENSGSENPPSNQNPANGNTPAEEKPEENTPIASNPQSGGIFAAYDRAADALLQSMSLEEKVGQMFLVRFPQSGVIEEIQSEHPGGYILFARDFKNETKDSIREKLQNCQNASKINLILGVDEEGGSVVRVSAYPAFRSSKFLSPQEIWARGQLPAILADSTEKSALLKSLGLNMNLTPVADVPTSSSSFIFKRSYGRGAEKTAIYVARLIETMNRDGMISVMKHFPGYGDNVDTHTGIAIDERPYSVFEQSDFLPFLRGIEAGAPCILVNHNIVKSMDAQMPASLSKNIHDILRNQLNFSGIIMTDDLEMDAVKEYADNGEAALQAVLAGNDMIISSNFKAQKREVLNAVNQGILSDEQINESVRRILAFKMMYHII